MANEKNDKSFLKDNELFSIFFVLIILILPIVMYITGKSTALSADTAWYDLLESENKAPDLMYSQFGLLVGVIANGCLGVAFFFMSKILIRKFDSPKTGVKDIGVMRDNSFVPSQITDIKAKERSGGNKIIENILFWLMPPMVFMYSIAYPLMVQFKSTVLGGVLNLIPGIFFAIMGGWWLFFYHSVIIAVLLWVFAALLIYTSIVLFIMKDDSSENNSFTTLTNNTINFFRGKKVSAE